MINRNPLFTADWPRYAMAAHIVFWAVSAVFLASCAGAVAGILPAGTALFLFAIWMVTAGLLGTAAACSGKLYVGNQVFSRTPLTGWPARLAGGLVSAGATSLILFGYAITFLGGS